MDRLKRIELTVPSLYSNERVDKVIAKEVPEITRSYIQKLIKDDRVKVNGKQVKTNYKLKHDDKILILLPEMKEAKALPEDIKLDVAYEDKDLIVVNKPQGMVTHPASGVYTGTLVNAVLHHCKDSLSGINGVMRPGIVHRLDKETSGLIIVCKNDKAHTEIANQIQERKLKRQYLAIVHGKMEYDAGKINRPIGRDKIHREKMTVTQKGRNAITHWKILKRFGKYTFIECTLETGRTHQIRVHMASLGHPVVGDKTYGKKNDISKRMMLHAYKLVFKHPTKRKEIILKTEIPERFKAFDEFDCYNFVL